MTKLVSAYITSNLFVLIAFTWTNGVLRSMTSWNDWPLIRCEVRWWRHQWRWMKFLFLALALWRLCQTRCSNSSKRYLNNWGDNCKPSMTICCEFVIVLCSRLVRIQPPDTAPKDSYFICFKHPSACALHLLRIVVPLVCHSITSSKRCLPNRFWTCSKQSRSLF